MTTEAVRGRGGAGGGVELVDWINVVHSVRRPEKMGGMNEIMVE
jgi:hypothetical protein